MDLPTVFAHKLRDLARRSNGLLIPGEDPQYSTLMAAPLLREILFGVPPLVHRVTPQGTKVHFTCCPLHVAGPVAIAVIADDFDPSDAAESDDLAFSTPISVGAMVMRTGHSSRDFSPFRPVPERLNLKKFLKAPAAIRGEVTLTVKDLIDHAANSGGGVHFAPEERHQRADARALNEALSIVGLEAGLHSLQAIGRVTVKALEPLVTV